MNKSTQEIHIDFWLKENQVFKEKGATQDEMVR